MSEQGNVEQGKRSLTDLSQEVRREIGNKIAKGIPYRIIMEDYQLKNLSTLARIKKVFVDGIGANQPRERKPMKESTKRKIQKSSLAAAQVMQHEIVAGREISMLDGILFSLEHLIKIVKAQDEKTTEAIEKLSEVHEYLAKKYKPNSVMETKAKFEVLGAITDTLTKLETFIQAHNTQIKAIAEIRQQSDHFVKHRDEIIGRDGVIRMIDDIFYCIAQLDEPSYNKFRTTIKDRSPLAFGLLSKMERRMLEKPQGAGTEVSVDITQQDQRLPE